jgi:hypothetical protein
VKTLVAVTSRARNDPKVALPDLEGHLRLDLVELAGEHASMRYPRGHIVVETTGLHWFYHLPTVKLTDHRKRRTQDALDYMGWVQLPDALVFSSARVDVRDVKLWVDSISFHWTGRVEHTGRLVETYPMPLSAVFGNMQFKRGTRGLRNE